MSNPIENHDNDVVQAVWIQLITTHAMNLDIDRLRTVVKDTRSVKSTQEAMILFRPDYPLQHIEMLEWNAKALEALCDFVEAVKKSHRLKEAGINEKEARKSTFSQLFPDIS
jgi:hypothetical protein